MRGLECGFDVNLTAMSAEEIISSTDGYVADAPAGNREVISSPHDSASAMFAGEIHGSWIEGD